VGSSRERTRAEFAPALICLLAFSLAALSCSTGHGEGDVSGQAEIPHCFDGTYDLGPTAFFGQAIEQLLRIRIQRGSDLEVRSDGLVVLVEDANLVKREYLNKDIDLAGEVPRIDLTMYLNDSCPPGRDRTPVVLPAVSGTIRFESIFAPQIDGNQVEITAQLSKVHFQDPRTPLRFMDLSGNFDFLYVRGSPAQRFP
jgi:hypothetical protein